MLHQLSTSDATRHGALLSHQRQTILHIAHHACITISGTIVIIVIIIVISVCALLFVLVKPPVQKGYMGTMHQ